MYVQFNQSAPDSSSPGLKASCAWKPLFRNLTASNPNDSESSAVCRMNPLI